MDQHTQIQFDREGILCDLAAARPHALTPDTIKRGRRIAGAPVESERIVQELDFLVAEGLVERTRSAISPAAIRFRITDAGVEFLKSEGLI